MLFKFIQRAIEGRVLSHKHKTDANTHETQHGHDDDFPLRRSKYLRSFNLLLY